MDDTTIQDAINEASSVVDSYVGGPYAPTDSVPDMVVYWTRDVAAFLATCTWRKSKDFQAMDPVLLRYQQALGRLAGIFAGTTNMPSNQLPTTDVYEGSVVNPIPMTLFYPWQFDLWGRGGYPVGAWPIIRQSTYYWIDPYWGLPGGGAP
jgi:phage gp36-like protein